MFASFHFRKLPKTAYWEAKQKKPQNLILDSTKYEGFGKRGVGGNFLFSDKTLQIKHSLSEVTKSNYS